MARAAITVEGRRRFSSDAWDGYPAARERVIDAIAAGGLGSCVVLSGDAHTSYVCDLKLDFDDEQAPAVATEVCGTSLTSRGRAQSATDQVVRENPHILYGDSAHRGYFTFDVTIEACTVQLLGTRTRSAASLPLPRSAGSLLAHRQRLRDDRSGRRAGARVETSASQPHRWSVATRSKARSLSSWTTSGSPTRPEPLHPVHRHDVRARSEEARAASLSR